MTLAYPRAYSPAVRQVLGRDEPVEFDTDRGTARLRMPGQDRLVLHRRPPAVEELLDETDRLLWLDGRAPSPRIVASGRAAEGDEAAVLAIGEMAMPLGGGRVPVDPEQAAIEVGRTLSAIHEIPPIDCPFTTSSTSLLGEIEAAIEQGMVSVAEDGPYATHRPADLLGILADLLEGLDEVEDIDLVVVHGGIDLDRVWFDPDGTVTLTGWGRAGLGDRHLDLAAAASALIDRFGHAVARPLLDAYGHDAGLDYPDLRRLDAHQLLVHLLP